MLLLAAPTLFVGASNHCHGRSTHLSSVWHCRRLPRRRRCRSTVIRSTDHGHGGRTHLLSDRPCRYRRSRGRISRLLLFLVFSSPVTGLIGREDRTTSTLYSDDPSRRRRDGRWRLHRWRRWRDDNLRSNNLLWDSRLNNLLLNSRLNSRWWWVDKGSSGRWLGCRHHNYWRHSRCGVPSTTDHNARVHIQKKQAAFISSLNQTRSVAAEFGRHVMPRHPLMTQVQQFVSRIKKRQRWDV